MNDILMCAGAVGIYFGCLVLRGVFGFVKNTKKYEDVRFDWRKFLKGSIKPVLITLSISALAALILAFMGLVNASGVEVQGLDQISTKTLLIGLFIADITAFGCTIAEGLKLFGLTDNEIRQIRHFIAENAENVETGIKVSEKDGVLVTEAFNVQHDGGDKEEIDASNIDQMAQMGAWPYYKVNIASPTDFYNNVKGKGFNEGYGLQCVAGFKEFQFCLAGRVVATNTGGASGYANQKEQIEALGFKKYTDKKLQNGDWVIFGGGQYGHVAMYYNGQFFGQNQGATDASIGNPFCLCSIGLSSYLCHYRPNIYAKKTPEPTPIAKKTNEEIAMEVIRGDWGNGSERIERLMRAGYDPVAIQKIVDIRLAPAPNDKVEYVYKEGDTFGQVILDLGLATSNGLWGPNGDVAYYTEQLRKQGITGNISVGTMIKLTQRG